MGAYPVVGAGCLCRREHDQRESGNSKRQTRVPRFAQVSQVPDSSRRVLRVAQDSEGETAILF